jgi:hypothetical protein
MQAQNNRNILYITNMVCFWYIIVNTMYKVNNNNNNNNNDDDNNNNKVHLRPSLKTHRNSTKLRTCNILMSNPTPSTQTEQYTYSVEISNSTNMLQQKKILWTTQLKYVVWMTYWCYTVKQKSKGYKETTTMEIQFNSLEFSFFNMLV